MAIQNKITKSDYAECVKITGRRHKGLKILFEVAGEPEGELPVWNSIDEAVFHCIAGQALSTKAANSIIEKLLREHGTVEKVIEEARKTHSAGGALKGLSKSKTRTLAEWREYRKKNRAIIKTWKNKPWKELEKEITSLWGFGKWSAAMTAIFYSANPNVWPETDLGVKKVSELIFGSVKYKDVEKYVKGYETIICLYIWRVFDLGVFGELREKLD